MFSMNHDSVIAVREFGLLLNGGDKSSIDCDSIPTKAFEWLLVNGQSNNQESVDLIKVKKQGHSIALQVINYVGVLETPCGTLIEILPKISEKEDNQAAIIDVSNLDELIEKIEELIRKGSKTSGIIKLY